MHARALATGPSSMICSMRDLHDLTTLTYSLLCHASAMPKRAFSHPPLHLFTLAPSCPCISTACVMPIIQFDSSVHYTITTYEWCRIASKLRSLDGLPEHSVARSVPPLLVPTHPLSLLSQASTLARYILKRRKPFTRSSFCHRHQPLPGISLLLARNLNREISKLALGSHVSCHMHQVGATNPSPALELFFFPTLPIWN